MTCVLCDEPKLKWTDVMMKINEIRKKGEFACSHTLLCSKHIEVFQEEAFGNKSMDEVMNEVPQKIAEIQKAESEKRAKEWRRK